MSLSILIVVTVLAVLSLFALIPLIAMMAGGSVVASVLFAIAMILPVTAIGGWVVYLSDTAGRGAGMSYGWIVGLVIVAAIALYPRVVVAPAAQRFAASLQDDDKPLTPIDPGGTIAVQTTQFSGYRGAAPDKPALVARLIAGGFDGVLLIETPEADNHEHITLAKGDVETCDGVLTRALARTAPDITDEEWTTCFNVTQAGLEKADVAYVAEREIFLKHRIAGFPHMIEVFRERVLRNTAQGWHEFGRETWVKHDVYKAPIPISSSAMLKPSPEARSIGLQGVLPRIWPGYRTSHQHPPQNATAPIPDLVVSEG